MSDSSSGVCAPVEARALGRLIESVSMTSPVDMSCPGMDGSTSALVVIAAEPTVREMVVSATCSASSRSAWLVQWPTGRSPVVGETGATGAGASGACAIGACKINAGAQRFRLPPALLSHSAWFELAANVGEGGRLTADQIVEGMGLERLMEPA